MQENRKNIVRTMKQLSEDCLKFNLLELYQSMIPPLVKLLEDKNIDIYLNVLMTLDFLALRDDLQICISKAGAVSELIKKYHSITDQTCKQIIVDILALLSNNDFDLLNNKEYIMFFIDVQKEISKRESDPFYEEEKATDLRSINTARLTLAGASESFVQSDMKKRMKFVASECRNENPMMACKAAGTFAVMASEYKYRSNLVKAGMVEELVAMLKHSNVAVVTQACKAIFNFTRGHDGMEIWFKFDSSYIYDATSFHILAETVECNHLPGDKGIYANWGMMFDNSKRIDVLDMPLLEEWTVACWFTWPLPKKIHGEKNYDSDIETQDHVLIQGSSMMGGFVVLRSDELGAYDQITGQFLVLWNNLNQLKKGWHHLAVTKSKSNRMQAYIDGQQKVKLVATVSLNEPMQYFCNDFTYNQPMGAVADLRVYRRALPFADVKSASKYTENVFDGLPDKYIEYINVAEGPLQLVELLKSDNEQLKGPAVMTLANLATKASCRASIVRSGGVPLLIHSLNTPISNLKFHVARTLINIA